MSQNPNSSHYFSMKDSNVFSSQMVSDPNDSFNKSYTCEIPKHNSKHLSSICTYPFCTKKGLICSLCQCEDHLAHSHYCFPWEIFIENIDKHRTYDKQLVYEMKKKLKAINNGSKKILKDFLKRCQDVCIHISKEIDKNVNREMKLLEEILARDRTMTHDLKKFDLGIDHFKKNLAEHLDMIKVEVNTEKIEKISFSFKTSQGFLLELDDLAKKSKEFEDYLRFNFEKHEQSLSKLNAMDFFQEEHNYLCKNMESFEENPKLIAMCSTQNTLTAHCELSSQIKKSMSLMDHKKKFETRNGNDFEESSKSLKDYKREGKNSKGDGYYEENEDNEENEDREKGEEN